MKNVLITGGSKGIGAAIAAHFSKLGYRVFINFSKDSTLAEQVKKRIEVQTGEAHLAPFDVSQPEEVDSSISEIISQHGPLEVLINNAGINVDQLLIRLKNEELEKILDVNLKGTIYCTRAAARFMMKAKSGVILNISSVVGEMGNAGQSAYAASKAGLIGFSKSVAKELASRQVRCNVITPGYIETEMTRVLTEQQKEAILRAIPLGVMGQPDDVASLCGFLASPNARYITGQVIGVNGGMYI